METLNVVLAAVSILSTSLACVSTALSIYQMRQGKKPTKIVLVIKK